MIIIIPGKNKPKYTYIKVPLFLCYASYGITRYSLGDLKARTEEWTVKVRSPRIRIMNRWYYSNEWSSLNKRAGTIDDFG